MSSQYIDIVLAHHRKISDRSGVARPLAEAKTIHCSNLPQISTAHALFCEWNTYRREVAQLLANGNEFKWLVIKEQNILGVFDSMANAEEIANQLTWPYLIRQVLEQEPVLRIRGYSLPWPSSVLPLAKPA